MTNQNQPAENIFKIRKSIREIEAHVKSKGDDRDTMIAILSKAQGLETARKNRTDETNLTVLSLVKSRIIRS